MGIWTSRFANVSRQVKQINNFHPLEVGGNLNA